MPFRHIWPCFTSRPPPKSHGSKQKCQPMQNLDLFFWSSQIPVYLRPVMTAAYFVRKSQWVAWHRQRSYPQAHRPQYVPRIKSSHHNKQSLALVVLPIFTATYGLQTPTEIFFHTLFDVDSLVRNQGEWMDKQREALLPFCRNLIFRKHRSKPGCKKSTSADPYLVYIWFMCCLWVHWG